MAFSLFGSGAGSNKAKKSTTKGTPGVGQARVNAGGPRPWSQGELRQLRTLCKQGASLRTISLQLGRSSEAVLAKAQEEQLQVAGVGSPSPRFANQF
ncbi:MAG TPA: hypothetical protein VEI97_19685 [bacterium]|nr:hypothetical protein [bacterium]